MASKFSLEGTLRLHDNFSAVFNGAKKSVTGFSSSVQRSFDGLNGNIQKFQNRIKDSKDSIQTFSMAAAGLTQAGRQLSSVGQGMLSIFSPVIEEGKEFEKTMSKVAAVSRLDKTSNAFKQLSATARELGATTQFSAKEAAEGMSFLAMAGFDANQQIEAMPSMLQLAQAGNIDLARAADIASNTLGAYKMKASELGRVGNVLAATFTRSNTDLNMLAETFKYAAPVAKAAGVEIEELAAMTGLLGDVGIQGSNAGTALRAALVRLTKQPRMTAKALRALGVQALDSAGNMRKMPELLEDIRLKTQGMGKGLRLAKISEIFGTEAAAAFAELISKADDSGKSITNFAQSIKEASKADELSKIAEKMADNFDGASKSFESAKSELMLIVWDAIKEPLTRLLKVVTSFVRITGEWAKNNPVLVKTIMAVIAIVGTFLTIMGTLLTMGGMVAGAFAFMSMASATFGITLSAAIWPVTLIVAGIVLLGAAIVGLIAYWDEIVATIKKVINWFVNLFSSMPGWAKIALVVFMPIIGIPLLIIKYWKPIKGFFISFFTAIKNAALYVYEGLKKVFLSFSNFFDANALPGWAKILIAILLPIISIPTLIYRYWKPIKGFFAGIFTSIKTPALDFFTVIKEKALSIYEAIKAPFVKVYNYVMGFWNGLSDETKTKILGLLSIFFPLLGLPLLIKSKWGVIKTFFSNLFGSLKGIVDYVMTWIVEKLSSIKSSITDVIGQQASDWLFGVEEPKKQKAEAKNAVTPASSGVRNRETVTTAVSKETTNRSQIDVNFNNQPENVSVERKGAMAPNTTLALGAN